MKIKVTRKITLKRRKNNHNDENLSASTVNNNILPAKRLLTRSHKFIASLIIVIVLSFTWSSTLGYVVDAADIERHKEDKCFCNPVGSITLICEERYGQCPCLPNVTGRRCDKCRPGHWNLSAGIGCVSCECDQVGSTSSECDSQTGQCDCKAGISGQRCDQCEEGFYNFNKKGCRRCDPCPVEGPVCDPFNGRCICPPNSQGLLCSQCVPGSWRWQNKIGCISCDCDMSGSIGHVCDTVSGQCACREGYSGRKCETCAVGYFGYPECRRCNCDLHGSFIRPDGLIACDKNGQCPCKALVSGLKCDTCRQGAFGLSNSNPEGCTRCFCFGRSDQCVQSDWSWGHIRILDPRKLSVQYLDSSSVLNSELENIVIIQIEGNQSHIEDTEISATNYLNLIPKSTGNISIGAYTTFNYPMYFQLPPQFYRDRTSSYGGNLVYTLLTEGGGNLLDRDVLVKFPLVQIHSHSSLIIDFYELDERFYTNNDTFSIPLHESYWKLNQNGHDVDRPTMMVALQNIKHIFVRGTTTTDFVQVIIQNVHMDSAIYINGSSNVIAKGVERCNCSKMYKGLSCQDPGIGYYRWKNNTDVQSTTFEDLIGQVVACNCNGRSNECDGETGVCLNCQENTDGDHCDRCAEGFNGDPITGTCQSGPCPLIIQNYAKGFWNVEVSCVCRPGYSGPLCDRCKPGFFGSPRSGNGSCRSCDCNLDGVASNASCNEETGQCHCRPGITGRKCDACVAQRHFFEDGRCKLCDECPLLLFHYLELINQKLHRGIEVHMETSVIPAPWLKLAEYEEYRLDVTAQQHDYTATKQMLQSYDDYSLQKLGSYAENNKFQLRQIAEKAVKLIEAASILKKDSDDVYLDIKNVRSSVNTILTLTDLETGDNHMNLPVILQETRYHLHQIQQHYVAMHNSYGIWEKAWSLVYFYGNASEAAFGLRSRLDMFMKDLHSINYRLSNFRVLTGRTFKILHETDEIHTHIVNLKSSLTEDYGKIRELLNDLIRFENQRPTTEISSYLDVVERSHEYVAREIDTMRRLSKFLFNSLEENDKIRKEVYKHWLPRAMKHAAELMEQSNEYMRQFRPTKDGSRIAMMARYAHKDISDAVAAARRSSFEAKEAASQARNKIYQNDASSVIQRARRSLGNSRRVQENALRGMEKANILKTKIITHNNQVQAIKSKITDVGIRLHNIWTILSTINTGASRQMVLESIEMAARSSMQISAESRRAFDINNVILRLREKITMLGSDFAIKIGLVEKNILQTKTNIRLIFILFGSVEEQATKTQQKIDSWNDNMWMQMQELRVKIAKARHAAAGIKVSVKSLEPKCVRSYLPSSYGLSISNSIKFSFALNNTIGYSPLIYIRGQDGRYISLELYNRRVRLKWNLGGSTEIISHPLEIQPSDPVHDNAWYHIEANRTLNIGSLLVRRMTNNGTLDSSITVTGLSDMEYTRFFQTVVERIWIGGYPGEAQLRDPLIGNGLNVIVHQVGVDNLPLGLWNFAYSEGKCEGAIMGAQESIVLPYKRYFNGLGYSEVKKSKLRPYRKNLFALEITFKTLDENSLLFLAVDDTNNRLISVGLRDGRILFRIDYGDDTRLEIKTTKKYNTGKWTKFEAARKFDPKQGKEIGSLRMYNDTQITGSPTAPIKSYMLPDLSKAVYYMGGLPPGLNSVKIPGADIPFIGCMMDIQINGEAYDPVASSTYFGVDQPCRNTINKAGFYGNGFVELSSQSTLKPWNTAFVFRTLQPHCLLLLSAHHSPETSGGHYDSISVLDGRICVWIDSGRSNIKLVSNSTVNDGEYHVVNLITNGRKFDLLLDDKLQDSKVLVAYSTMVSIPHETGGLYVGGAPEYAQYKLLAPTLIPLVGAIQDIVFNNKTVYFNQALSFSNVQIGRNGPQMGSL